MKGRSACEKRTRSKEVLLKVSFRIILSERDERDLQPMTEFPDPDSRLPSDLHLSQPLAKQQPSPPGSASSLRSDLTDISQFGKQAQVVSLIGRILQATRSTTENEHEALLKLAELAGLDTKIRSLLAMIMEEDSRRHASQTNASTAIALSIR